MKSMTGYGSSSFKSQESEVTVVVRTVNGRFLEPRFHLPKDYFGFESTLKRKLSQFFRRGTVDVYVHRNGPADLSIQMNTTTAKKWLKAHKQLAKTLNLKLDDNIFVERLAALPHIFVVQEGKGPGASEKKMFLNSFSQALKNCEKEREREGLAIQKHLISVLNKLSDSVRKMDALRKRSNEEYADKLKQRVARFGQEAHIEPSRVAQELIIYLDKSDIAEEIERLREHTQMCREFLKSPAEKGKKLDFYSQELLREVNTIGSKAHNAGLTEQVVIAKGLIEAFKEQVQNLE